MALDALLQQREVQVLRFDSKAMTAGIAPTDAELAAYHKANENDFRAPEQAQIEYVVLDVDAIASRAVRARGGTAQVLRARTRRASRWPRSGEPATS